MALLKEKGLDLLTFEEVCVMLGVDDLSLLSKMEKGMTFQINKDFIEKLKDPEIRNAMIESFKATKH